MYAIRSYYVLEVGYRTKPMKNLMLDFEAFYTKGKDYSALMPDSMSTVTFRITSYNVCYTKLLR